MKKYAAVPISYFAPSARQIPWAVMVLLTFLLMVLAACTSNTGLLGGGSWQASGLAKQHLQALAIDPNNLQHIFAGDAQDGVFASNDAGATWHPASIGLPVPLTISALSFDVSGKQLYAATSAGLYVSSNSAATWNLVKNAPPGGYSELALDINTAGMIYAAGNQVGQVRASDQGASWTPVSQGLPEVPPTALVYDPNAHQLFVAIANALYRSDDQGQTWRLMDDGLPAARINVLALGAVNSSGDLVFAGTDQGFYLTSDGGRHWMQSQTSLTNLKITSLLLDNNQPAEVYAASSLGVLRSTDNGQTWGQLATGLSDHQNYTALAQGDVSSSQLFVAGQGVYRYPGNGTIADPSRFVPILLVLLFFAGLYLLLARFRRRALRRSSPNGRQPLEPSEQASRIRGPFRKTEMREHLNGNRTAAGNTRDSSENEQEDS